MSEHSKLLQPAISAVADACKLTRAIQSKLGDIKQATKDDRSPVTVADYAAQAIIAAQLNQAFGDLMLVGEEDAGDLREDNAAPLRDAVVESSRSVWPEASEAAVLDAIDLGNHDGSASAYWTLDPIDGTKGFLRGGQYAVSLAYIVNGIVEIGVLGCPNLSADFDRVFDSPDAAGTLYHATRAGGAWSRPLMNIAEPPIQVSSSSTATAETMRVCESVEAAHSRLDDTTRIVDRLGARGTPARLDSQCKYAVVARGQADAYLRLPTRADYVEKIWDHAAGMIIAQEAGAIVTDVHGNSLDFSHGALLIQNKGVICAAESIHGEILQAIRDLGLFRL